MANNKRKERNQLSKKVDITKPLDVLEIEKLGTDDDPCFGKLHDLTEDACKRCGDSHICQIVFNGKTKAMRDDIESKNRFKDLELDKNEINTGEIKKFIKSKLSKGVISLKIVKQLQNKFGIEKQEARKLVKKYK